MDKKQKTAKNPINKQDNKRFQFALTAALNHEQIKKTLKEYIVQIVKNKLFF